MKSFNVQFPELKELMEAGVGRVSGQLELELTIDLIADQASEQGEAIYEILIFK